jgi:hypothetical protein
MTFKEWLVQETGTSTANIACYPRMVIPSVRREPKKKKTYEVPQVKESTK